MSDNIYSLVYTSLAENGFDLKGAADEIYAEAQAVPAASRITGALMFDGKRIAQVLEGPLSELEEIYDSISADLRHHSVQVLDFAQRTERSFEGWTVLHLDQPATDVLEEMDFNSTCQKELSRALVSALANATARLHDAT